MSTPMRWKRARYGPRIRALGATRARDQLSVVLGRELERARGDGRSLSLVVVALDHFEHFTATHARSVSNRVLRTMAKLVRAHSRENDMVMPLGDVLVCILPGLPPGGSTRFSFAVHQAIEQHRFEPGGHRFTVSLGTAELGPDVTGANELLHAAEARLGLVKSLLSSERVIGRPPHGSYPVGPDTADPPRRHACLVVVGGRELGRKHPLERRETSIGRATDSDIVVNDDSASHVHATLTADDVGVTIRDQGSEHGTHVNGVVIHDARLENGDIIDVGGHRFKLLLGEDIESLYHDEIHRLSTVDELTEVFSERYFIDCLGRELSRARRFEQPLALVMLDIDGFERCNDTLGRRAGDHVLKTLTTLVRDRARTIDVVARHGGDELAITLPGCDLPAAAAFAETLREAVARARVEFEGHVIPLTISLGAAAIPPDVTDADHLVRLAEARLARAKTLGRNRVVSSDEQAEAADAEPRGSAVDDASDT